MQITATVIIKEEEIDKVVRRRVRKVLNKIIMEEFNKKLKEGFPEW